MKIKYIILAGILIVLGLGLVLLPEKEQIAEISPEKLLMEINDPARFTSTDKVAEMIIEGDPSLLLVDTRDEASFKSYHLPGAINIPLKDVLQEYFQGYLDQEAKNIVFYSNGDIYADQAWVLCTRLGYKEMYVMKGGLNCWAETILQPPLPEETDPTEAFDLYQFRQGASMYFGGSSHSAGSSDPAEIITVTRKKKKNIVEGGC